VLRIAGPSRLDKKGGGREKKGGRGALNCLYTSEGEKRGLRSFLIARKGRSERAPADREREREISQPFNHQTGKKKKRAGADLTVHNSNA